MIVVKLKGGLGNQMFQYATGKGLLKNRKQVDLDHHFLDTNNIDTEHFTSRGYELNIFKNLKARKAKTWQILLFKSQSFHFRVLRFFLKKSIQCIHQKENEYILFPNLREKRHLYLDGYFQSENYFKTNREDVLKDFQFPLLDPLNEALKKKITATDSAVSVHIRRGDYLKSKTILDIHGVLPFAYYMKAINILQAKCPSITLFIFSDDIDWVKANLNFDNISLNFIDINHSTDHWKDMALMSYCKHHIIANSSFSWWGAWLSESNGHVFAPSHWFNPLKANFNIQDFIPERWTIVTYD
ncbi:MAG: alpha-1,2-fucosyltransferase [Pyrinomonadaceae bacterium]|nr:alpha-1,2-fucosyltransferase [Sphingobacteriaceae bacterium]